MLLLSRMLFRDATGDAPLEDAGAGDWAGAGEVSMVGMTDGDMAGCKALVRFWVSGLENKEGSCQVSGKCQGRIKDVKPVKKKKKRPWTGVICGVSVCMVQMRS